MASDGVNIRDRPVNLRQPLAIVWDKHALALLDSFKKQQASKEKVHTDIFLRSRFFDAFSLLSPPSLGNTFNQDFDFHELIHVFN